MTKVAPVQGDYRGRPDGTVPWSVHLQAFEVYSNLLGKSQSAERIAERGGFGYRELQCLLAGHYTYCAAEHDPVPGWVAKP